MLVKRIIPKKLIAARKIREFSQRLDGNSDNYAFIST
jgi:hypothetical protein